MTEHIAASFAAESATLRAVLQAIQDGAQNVAFAVDADNRLTGLMTDGDVRRALLGGAALDDAAAPYVSRDPLLVNENESRSVVLDFMRARVINQIPVVDDDGVLVGLHTLQGMVGRQPRPNVAVILAGGRGTRLHPLTEDIPKAMVHVAGRPILERIITHLVGYGITDVVLAVGHLSAPIEEFFGDGSAFGCRVRYLREDPETPLGTAGALANLAGLAGKVDDSVLVMNGDLLTSVDVGALLSSHAASGAALTIATKNVPFQVPYAVIDEADGRVIGLVEKPVFEHVVNIGVYALSPDFLSSVPVGVRYDMTDLASDLLGAGHAVMTWQSEEDWIDIGSPIDLRRARGMRP